MNATAQPTRADVNRLMKRCQIGVGGRHALDEAHNIMAECYGTLGRQQIEIERLRAALATEEACARLHAGLLREVAAAIGNDPGDDRSTLPERVLAMRAELDRCGKENCMGRKAQSTATWVTWEAREATVAAERERCAKLCEERASDADLGASDQLRCAAADIRAGVSEPEHYLAEGDIPVMAPKA